MCELLTSFAWWTAAKGDVARLQETNFCMRPAIVGCDFKNIKIVVLAVYHHGISS